MFSKLFRFIKLVVASKITYLLLLIISITVNLLMFYAQSLPIYDRIQFAKNSINDGSDASYLVSGITTFQNKKDQPKDLMQIMSFYFDSVQKKYYYDEVDIINNILVMNARKELEIVSVDEDMGSVTLSGYGWGKIIIDLKSRKILYMEDSDGDITTLRSTWEI